MDTIIWLYPEDEAPPAPRYPRGPGTAACRGWGLDSETWELLDRGGPILDELPEVSE